MPNFIQVTPFLHVPDLGAALKFFTEVLNFEIAFRSEMYAYVERHTVAFRLLQQTPDHPQPPGNRRYAYYIDVRDVDALHAELKPQLDTLPPGDVHGPVNQGYGQRELMVLGPDGNLIVFGQAISS